MILEIYKSLHLYDKPLLLILTDPYDILHSQHLELVSPFQLYYNPTTVLKNYQLWRLVTTFLYFGSMSFSFFFNLVFTYRYCRMLEEGSFRNRSADFVMMFLFGGALMLVCRRPFAGKTSHVYNISNRVSLF